MANLIIILSFVLDIWFHVIEEKKNGEHIGECLKIVSIWLVMVDGFEQDIDFFADPAFINLKEPPCTLISPFYLL